MNRIDLTGKTAIVTGASQGLGQATAEALHAAGASVVVNYFSDPHGKNKIRAESVVRSLGQRAIAAAADVRGTTEVEAMFALAKREYGAVDIVINNAGIVRDRTVQKMTDAEWQEVLDTNLSGVFKVSREAVKHLQRGGRIVNLASIAGAVGAFGQANYAAAKGGVVSLTKVLSRELARQEINVNAVAPGVIDTEMSRTIPEEVLVEMMGQIPLGRFGEPSEIADVVLFLCSDLASYVTGQTIHVNGGWWSP